MVGWFGCLVTAINLLPVSQLDGGHILYSIFGRRHYLVSLSVVAVMVALAISFQYYGWLVWALLVTILGLRHPPLADEATRVDGRRLALGALALLVFIGCFVPVPIEIPELFDQERDGNSGEELMDTPLRNCGDMTLQEILLNS
jgi:membrane-associated protease RseP (regulator of RpoE activity)